MMTMDELRKAVSASAPLEVRLERCLTLVGAIASGRDMRMTVPALPTDDDMLLSVTLAEAAEFVKDAAARGVELWARSEVLRRAGHSNDQVWNLARPGMNLQELASAAGFAVERDGKIFAEHREGMCTEEVQRLAVLIATNGGQPPDLLGLLKRIADAEFGYGGWPDEAEIRAAIAAAESATGLPACPKGGEHNIVSARNEVIQSGLICTKCRGVFPEAAGLENYRAIGDDVSAEGLTVCDGKGRVVGVIQKGEAPTAGVPQGDVPADVSAVLEKHFGQGAHLAGNRAAVLDACLMRAVGVPLSLNTEGENHG